MMINNESEFIEYIVDFGCPIEEAERVLNHYLDVEGSFPVTMDFLNNWLENWGYLNIDIYWNDDKNW